MNKAILATKVGMTQIFNEDGSLIPVTVLQAGPCVVTQIKTVENDGYSAVQVGLSRTEISGDTFSLPTALIFCRASRISYSSAGSSRDA